MKIKIALTLALFGFGLMTFLSSGEASQNPAPQSITTTEDLSRRIAKLESRVIALEAQVKELELKTRYKYMSVPGAAIPGKQIPPGSHKYNFGGQDIWVIPVGPDGKSREPVMKMQ